ncbi:MULTISPECIES: dockerin type I domain-containing protein [unclassified Ruminococcus]|uniref:dockerin type I domain-containing protein n=1 Tax=unclassified Ruminococcus TaxID=2608920 RepID=UPI00210865B6|nr:MULTISPECIES: dockerin type I domain-containing protein [unclassified Ruminococcus]MCQ4021855.1 hypothetical protein [Ruminococcus sp. zg-924]MCQ4114300.1 hypothetical protein [Ruminococcus sp. zg-921]
MKNKLLKISSFVLAAAVALASAPSALALSSDKIISKVRVEWAPSSVSGDILAASKMPDNLSQQVLSAVDDIVKGVRNFEESIDISAYGIYADEMTTIIGYVRNENPDLINLSNAFSYSRYSDGQVVDFYPKYLFTAEEQDDYFTPFYAEIDKIVALAQSQSTDFAKALYVHDYIVSKSEYATEVYDSQAEPSPFVYNAYGTLVNKRSVCQGYSFAYKAVMSRLSIEVGYALSEEMNHVWNTVDIGGKTYHIDLTYDDPVPDKVGYVGHSSFLCTDEEIKASDHYSWTTSDTISETSYPNRFWNDVDSKICVMGDEAVYAAYDSQNDSYLERRNLVTNEAETVPSALTGVYWQTLDHSGYFIGDFSRLELIGNVIYYSLPNGVNAIAFDGSDDQRVYTLPDTATGLMYGFAERDGVFLADVRKTPNETGVISEISLSPFVPSAVQGDIDGNGTVTMRDAILLQKYTIGLSTLDEAVLARADMNGDQKVTMIDAILIQRMTIFG